MRTAFDDDEQRLLTLAHAMQLLRPGVEAAWRDVHRTYSMENGQWKMENFPHRY
jgi:hypothetical protein